MVNTPIELDYLHTPNQQTVSDPVEAVVMCRYCGEKEALENYRFGILEYCSRKCKSKDKVKDT